MKIKVISFVLLITTLCCTCNNIAFAANTVSDLGGIKSGANGFINVGEGEAGTLLPETSIKNISDMVYSILLAVAVAVAIIVGLIIGIKFMLDGAEGKADVKKALVPYVAGCMVVFGSFGIWKIIVEILQNAT